MRAACCGSSCAQTGGWLHAVQSAVSQATRWVTCLRRHVRVAAPDARSAQKATVCRCRWHAWSGRHGRSAADWPRSLHAQGTQGALPPCSAASAAPVSKQSRLTHGCHALIRAAARLGAVGGADEQDAALGGRRVAALHLHQQLSLEPPARLVLACARAGRVRTLTPPLAHRTNAMSWS